MKSTSSFRHVVLASLLLFAGGGKVLGCGSALATFWHGDDVYQECETDDDCGHMPGTFCGVFVCVCEEEDKDYCPNVRACLPEDACRVDATGGGGGGAGGMPMNVCDEASDCPQPPDARCGYAECNDGKCLLVITPGAAESQKRGDCKAVYCDTAGNAKEANDPSDLFNDGKPCTYDYCEDGEPRNDAFPDGGVCPEVGDGVCFEGDCVECYASAPVNYCPQNLGCDGVYCVSMLCIQNQMCGDQCVPCKAGGFCDAASDCESGVCANNSCAVPTCQDGVQNGSEAGLDCGAVSCANKCPDGDGCASHDDCLSGVCWGAVCQEPTCSDGVQNGEEGGIDCGAGCPTMCKI